VNDTLIYSWNFGDGSTPVLGQNANHTFAASGNFTIILTVTDKDGAASTKSVSAQVDNPNPILVDIVQPITIKEGTSAKFQAKLVQAVSQTPLTYSWNFGDNTPPVIGQNVNHTFADNGNYNIVLTVTGKDGSISTQTAVAKVNNVAPVIVSIVKPDLIKEGQSATFNALATDIGSLDTLTYSWNFGDNTAPVTGQNVDHTFVDNGNYNVILTATDKDGGVTSKTVKVKVDNVAPLIVSIVKPDKVNEGQAVQFSALATDPGQADTLTYKWNFSDGTPQVTGQNVSHTFADNGSYNMQLTVTDKDGGITTQTLLVKVDNVAPTIVSMTKPDIIKEGQSVQFKATATDPGKADGLIYSWNFGDGTAPVVGRNVNHTFADNGNYNVVLTVTDKDGGVTTQNMVTKVDNVAPTIINIIKPNIINKGQIIDFSAIAADVGMLDVLSYSWSFDDIATPILGQQVTHTFASSGYHNVIVTVTDKDGGLITKSIRVKVI
jgi:PKD repeat protein